jgi:hypothetical protein
MPDETLSIALPVDQARRLLFAAGWTRYSPSGAWGTPDGSEHYPQTDEALTVLLGDGKTAQALEVGTGA